MLMVVFGAGASYDSSTDYSSSEERTVTKEGIVITLAGIRPPLANQLFELRKIFTEAAQSIPKCLTIIDRLRYLTPDTSVEQQLEKLREHALSYPEGQRQLVSIRFYLQWIITRCQREWNDAIKLQTNYRILLGQIDRQLRGELACFVTFNYDTLLEEAFTSLDRRFASLNDYVSSSDYRIIKLHGSINWARELTSPMATAMVDHVATANDVLKTAEKLKISDKYHIVSQSGQHIVSFMEIPGKSGRQIVFPAIAIPLEKKREYECPAEHLKALEECILRTDRLLIIGWKGAEENFVNLLTKGLKKGIPKMVVSRSKDSAEKIRSSLVASGVDEANWSLGEGGFRDEVRSGRIEDFIRMPETFSSYGQPTS